MSNDVKAVPLYFITGFLGSGKTTLLNRALDEASARGMRLGVIINEWGQVSIDAGLVPPPANGVESEIEITELNDGQVFCSCLTADFIKALQLFAERNLDAVIVETSGMANPFPLKKLLADLAEKTGQHYKYAFMTALVDPESFLELIGVINAVEEQIIASQRIIINKIDLATPEQIAETRKKIENLNPTAQIIETTQAQIKDFFAPPHPSLMAKKPGPGQFSKPAPEYPRPGNFVITTPQKLSIDVVKQFMKDILPHALRVKGIIEAPDGSYHYVDGVNKRVENRLLSGERSGESKIVVIPKGGENIRKNIREACEKYIGSPYNIS